MDSSAMKERLGQSGKQVLFFRLLLISDTDSYYGVSDPDPAFFLGFDCGVGLN
jgi:hypothetical protein